MKFGKDIQNDAKEFKPSIFSVPRLAIIIALTAALTIIGLSILPKIINLYKTNPEDPLALQVLLIMSALVILPIPIVFAFILFKSRGKKILIDNDSIHFLGTSIIGTENIKTFNLNEITLIGYKKKPKYSFSLLPFWSSFFEFCYKNGKIDEVLLDGWSNGTLKKVIFYIKEKFPNIKFDTHIYSDSAKELSDLKEFIDRYKANSNTNH